VPKIYPDSVYQGKGVERVEGVACEGGQTINGATGDSGTPWGFAVDLPPATHFDRRASSAPNVHCDCEEGRDEIAVSFSKPGSYWQLAPPF
jgi:hypothetical protein